jgi:hypothetical protein
MTKCLLQKEHGEVICIKGQMWELLPSGFVLARRNVGECIHCTKATGSARDECDKWCSPLTDWSIPARSPRPAP